MSEKRFSLKEWEDLNYCEHCFYDGENQLSDSDVVVLLNEQDRKVRQLERSIERREEQISIIKKHCLKFLTDEQFEAIRKELENE